MFVLAYDATDNNEASIKANKKYFYLRAKIESYNLLIHERNFYEQPTNDLTKQYYEVRKVATGQGDDDTTKCLLDYTYFRDNCRLIEDSNILLKGITKTIENETKEQIGRFLGMLLGNLGSSLLGNMLIRKGLVRSSYENKKKKEF